MADTKTMIEQAYFAFNKRDIDGALALMTEDVSWPKASEGGKVVGKEEIRSYWTRQWGEFDPHVEPLAITEEDGGKIRVRVHQLVKSLQGDVLSDGEVLHIFTVNSGLIVAMDLGHLRFVEPSKVFNWLLRKHIASAKRCSRVLLDEAEHQPVPKDLVGRL